MFLADFRTQRSQGVNKQKSGLVSTASCRISSFRPFLLSRLEQDLLSVFEQLLSSGATSFKFMLTAAVVEVHVCRDFVVDRHYFCESRNHMALGVRNKRFCNSFGGKFKQLFIETCSNIEMLSYLM